MDHRRSRGIGLSAICAAIVLGAPAAAFAGGATSQAGRASFAAGYFQLAGGKGAGAARAGATFRIPAVTGCGATAAVVIFGAFVVPVATPSRPAAAAGVIVECPGGATRAAVYRAILLTGPIGYQPGIVVKAGDEIAVSAAASSATGPAVSFKDLTRSGSFSASGNQPATGTLAAFDGAGAVPGNTASGWLPIPHFGQVAFTHGTIDGTSVGAANASALDMAGGKDIQIHTGPLNPAGTAWTELFRAST